jgi:pyridoxine 4-dehydrogenase
MFERRYQSERNLGSSEGLQQKNWWNFSPAVATKPKYSLLQQQVATKLAPYPWRVTRGQIVSAAEASLQRLEQPKLAVAQVHWSTANYQPFQERALWEGIGDVYDRGLCDAVGVSNYGPIQMQKVASYMQDRDVPLAIAQIQYSLMTYKEAKSMNAVCEDVNCRLISYSPLCLGLLTGKYTLDNLPRNGNPRRQLFRELLPGAQDLLGTLGAVAAEYGKSQTQVAINWAICKGTVPIPGARTIEQARENLGSTGWSLKPDAVEALDIAASNVKKPMIRNIFQTK